MILATLMLSAVLATSVPAAAAPAAQPAAQCNVAVQNAGFDITQIDPQKPALKTTCTATKNCPSPYDPGPITCTGNSTCVSSYWAQIQCDGVTYDCGCSIAPSGCSYPFDYCLCRSTGGSHLGCKQNHC